MRLPHFTRERAPSPAKPTLAPIRMRPTAAGAGTGIRIEDATPPQSEVDQLMSATEAPKMAPETAEAPRLPGLIEQSRAMLDKAFAEGKFNGMSDVKIVAAAETQTTTAVHDRNTHPEAFEKARQDAANALTQQRDKTKAEREAFIKGNLQQDK